MYDYPKLRKQRRFSHEDSSNGLTVPHICSTTPGIRTQYPMYVRHLPFHLGYRLAVLCMHKFHNFSNHHSGSQGYQQLHLTYLILGTACTWEQLRRHPWLQPRPELPLPKLDDPAPRLSCPTTRFRCASQSPIPPRFLHAAVSLRGYSAYSAWPHVWSKT